MSKKYYLCIVCGVILGMWTCMVKVAYINLCIREYIYSLLCFKYKPQVILAKISIWYNVTFSPF